MSAQRIFTTGFFSDEGFDFETRVMLGQATYGGADTGEILATIALIEDGSEASWVAAWCGLGDRLAALAQDSQSRGHRVSAAAAWLRASVAYAATLNALACDDTLEGLLPVFRKHRQAWSRCCELQLPPWEPVAIPYEGGSLPGWFVAGGAAGGGPRPTLILNNGSDGPITSMLAFGGAGALARGYNVLFFDGPGQQSQLFEQGSFFRHDWEAVITPVVDFLLGRPEVDAGKLALYGVSQAGYWVPRAIAFEHRLAAAVADTGVVDVSASWLRHLPPELHTLLEQGDKQRFNAFMAQGGSGDAQLAGMWNFRSRPYGSSDPYEVFSLMLKYRIDAALAAGIRTPLLITDPEGEQFWPGQAERLAALTAGVSTLQRFTAAQGANFHCEPMARRLVDQHMFDWLDDQLGRRA